MTSELEPTSPPSGVETSLILQSEFVLGGLSIKEELLGARHEFLHEGTLVRARLPTAEEFEKRQSGRPTDLMVQGLRDGPTGYFVQNVAFNAFPDEKPIFPIDRDRRVSFAHNDPQVFELVERYARLMQRAFRRWSKILRWKTRRHWLGRDEPRNSDSWNATLYDRSDKSTICGLGNFFANANVVEPLGAVEWLAIQQTLIANEESPVYVDLFHDAEWRCYEQFDFRRTVIEAASACEIFMRTKVIGELHPGTNQAILKHLESVAISNFYKEFFPPMLPGGRKNPIWDEIKEDLNKLFLARNRLLHAGIDDHLTREACEAFLDATRKLLKII